MEKIILGLLLIAVPSQAEWSFDYARDTNWTWVCDGQMGEWNMYCECDKMDGTTHNRELLGTELSMDECKELCLQDSDCKAIEHWMLKSECYKCIDPSKRYPRSSPTTYPTVIEKGQSGYEGIRLADGTNEYEGRLEILFRGKWGTVCDDNFGMEDANVACKMLGLGRAIGFVDGNSWPNFGRGDWNSQIWFDDLMCTGEESNLFDCIHRGVRNGDCNHNSDVGVVCEQPCYDLDTQFKGEPVFERGKNNALTNILSAYECQKKCEQIPICQYFTWNSGTGPGRWNKKNENTCWLKTDKVKVMRRNKDSGKISGPRKC